MFRDVRHIPRCSRRSRRLLTTQPFTAPSEQILMRNGQEGDSVTSQLRSRISLGVGRWGVGCGGWGESGKRERVLFPWPLKASVSSFIQQRGWAWKALLSPFHSSACTQAWSGFVSVPLPWHSAVFWPAGASNTSWTWWKLSPQVSTSQHSERASWGKLKKKGVRHSSS